MGCLMGVARSDAVIPAHRTELHNLATDPSEPTNIADKNPDVVARMKARIVDLSKTGGPPLAAWRHDLDDVWRPRPLWRRNKRSTAAFGLRSAAFLQLA